MRLRVGLTGGIGAGKSEAARAFAALGALVIDADLLAREALAKGSPGLARLASMFEGILQPDGELDRPALAAIVFRDPAARERVTAIVHPFVRERSAAIEAAADDDTIVVHDVPLLFEAGFSRMCDANVVVVAEAHVREQRVVARSGLAPDEIARRMKAQIDPDRARELADYTLVNDGSLERLRAEVAEVYDDLLTRRRTVSRAAIGT